MTCKRDTRIFKASRNYGSRWAVQSCCDARDMFLYKVNIFPVWPSGECGESIFPKDANKSSEITIEQKLQST